MFCIEDRYINNSSFLPFVVCLNGNIWIIRFTLANSVVERLWFCFVLINNYVDWGATVSDCSFDSIWSIAFIVHFAKYMIIYIILCIIKIKLFSFNQVRYLAEKPSKDTEIRKGSSWLAGWFLGNKDRERMRVKRCQWYYQIRHGHVFWLLLLLLLNEGFGRTHMSLFHKKQSFL